MKLFSAAVLCLVVALAAACTEYSCTNSDTNDEIEETLTSDRRSLGLDENFKKEVEIKNKSGASTKVSKNFSFNDGGTVAHLPPVLDSITKNNVKLYSEKRQKYADDIYRVGQVFNIGYSIHDTIRENPEALKNIITIMLIARMPPGKMRTSLLNKLAGNSCSPTATECGNEV